MTRILAISALIGCLQGCAPQHYTVVQAEKLTAFLHAPQARQVQFASSVDHYVAHDATRNPDGFWVITNLDNQEFQYFYLVDGKPFVPECRFRENDDFGAINCRYLP